MNRTFNIGDRIVCTVTGVVGKCIKFYTPTASAEQTMVLTDDGRRYHAPTSEWKLVDEERGYIDSGLESGIISGLESKLLNPYGEYLLKFAENHGMSIDEAAEQPMVKARLAYFNATGM